MSEEAGIPRAPEPSSLEVVQPQREMNVRVRRALDALTTIFNSLVRGGELARTGGNEWTIVGSEAAEAALAELEDAVTETVAGVEARLGLLETYWRLLLRAWICTGFPPPPGIPETEIAAAMVGLT